MYFQLAVLLYSLSQTQLCCTLYHQIRKKCQGLDPNKIENCYLESKRMGENLCIAWHHQKKIPIQIVRPAITYGPGVPLDDGRSYADFIKNILNNENIKLHSKGDAIRNFCYIADFISGFFFSFFHGNIGDTYNISSEREYSIGKNKRVGK